MKPAKLSATQLKRFMSLVVLSSDLPAPITMKRDVQQDLLDNKFALPSDAGLAITNKGVIEIGRLSHIAGIKGKDG